ncbi:hypothetical protein DAPPUDRAFT_259252 [Daphnia pulex]|uniref:Uncharacterized protein n=1 Tax=Daphnia pulex TaxID=6669 RepID=E9HGY4_DAPPU|nr:hypothetical protein DAPPUDRAFT_259252 [Daphnia pulex]|eukprot:EFX68964.1 hypothetical protein DAPPUDRAFT_259252 [Daphnia pulex]
MAAKPGVSTQIKILWVGHWIDGVGATVGEEQEQVNASMSLYGNRTKHMTPGTEAFSMELKDLLETFKLSETDLPGIKDRLKKKAASSARKNDDGPGPPCYLNDLEAQYSEMQILKKRREKTATTAKERSKMNRVIGATKKKAQVK